MGFKIKFKNLLQRGASASGSSGYGGDGGGGDDGGDDGATPTTPPRVPLAPPPASPTSPPPLQAPRLPPRPAGKDTDEGPDDENSQEVADDERKNWKQLLDGKRTYLRPPRGHHVLGDVFKCPDTRKAALGRQVNDSRVWLRNIQRISSRKRSRFSVSIMRTSEELVEMAAVSTGHSYSPTWKTLD
ncbi:hypothetical protein ACQJBY_013679 [Aegilops geniculata]